MEIPMSFYAPAIFADQDRSSVRVITLLDPSVDLDATRDAHGFEYQESRKRKHVVLHAGQSPSEFEIMPVGIHESDSIRATSETHAMEHLRFYARGVLRIHGVRRDGAAGPHNVILEGADIARVPYPVKVEIGGHVKRLSEYTPPDFLSPPSQQSSTATES